MKIMRFIGMRVCDFGLYVLSLGPMDFHDRHNYKVLIEKWRQLNEMKT